MQNLLGLIRAKDPATPAENTQHNTYHSALAWDGVETLVLNRACKCFFLSTFKRLQKCIKILITQSVCSDCHAQRQIRWLGPLFRIQGAKILKQAVCLLVPQEKGKRQQHLTWKENVCRLLGNTKLVGVSMSHSPGQDQQG